MIQKQKIKRIRSDYFKYIFISVLFLSISLFPQIIKETHAQSHANVRGWAWSSYFGWVSLYGEGVNPYGVTIDPVTGIMSGFAWSPNIGWVSFDYGENTLDGPPPTDELDPGNYLNTIGYDPTRDLSSPCTASENEPPCTAWFDINTLEDGNGVMKGWARVLSYRNEYGVGAGWLRLRGVLPTEAQFGVDISFTRAREDPDPIELEGSNLDGFGYASDPGLGFLDFRPGPEGGPDIGGIAYKAPYIETELGDIYAKEGVGDLTTFVPPRNYYNAAYTIMTNGSIVNFCSAAQGNCTPDPDPDISEYLREYTNDYPFGPYFLPHQVNRYTNVLGKIDIEGLLPCTGTPCTNKYGFVVDDTINNTNYGTRLSTLDNGIYYYDETAPFVINDILTILNNGGAGLLIVEGDLAINNNIRYNIDAVTNIHDLASLGVIVRGNITIDTAVSEIVGAYVVLGKGAAERCPVLEDPPGVCSETPDNRNISCSEDADCNETCLSCGRISTGGSETTSLTVNGLMMARQFSFQRGVISVDGEPSEKIVFDGRAVVNPPPGLQDFSKVLPVFKEVTP